MLLDTSGHTDDAHWLVLAARPCEAVSCAVMMVMMVVVVVVVMVVMAVMMKIIAKMMQW